MVDVRTVVSLLEWPKSLTHGRGAYARAEEGDGWCAVPVQTMAGCWPLVRSGLRPHQGILHEQRSLPGWLRVCAPCQKTA